jgi:hypothetical protein
MNADLLSLFAYIGPGADLGLISSVIGLALTMGASGLFIVIYPFRSLLRRIRGVQKATSEEVSSTN